MKNKIKEVLETRKTKKFIENEIDYHTNLPKILIRYKKLEEYIPTLTELCNIQNKLINEYEFLTATDEIVFAKLVLSRNQDFFEGIILSMWNNNTQAIYPLMRALVEDLFLLKYVDKNPNYIKEYVNSPTNTRTDIGKFKNQCPDKDLIDYYGKLCNVAHPNPDAIKHNLYDLYTKDGRQQTGESVIRIGEPYDEFYRDIVKALIRIYSEEITIIDELHMQNFKNNILKNKHK
jgi:hypothetical protein